MEKTGILVIVDEVCKTCSVSAEIAALVAEEGFNYLTQNIVRINIPDVPIPYTPILEKQIIPSAVLIENTITQIL